MHWTLHPAKLGIWVLNNNANYNNLSAAAKMVKMQNNSSKTSKYEL